MTLRINELMNLDLSPTSVAIPSTITADTLQYTPVKRRRRVSHDAGRALEILGHAIEYLADEYVHEGGSPRSSDAQVQAVQLLMSANRQVYFECPVEPTLGERLNHFLHLKSVLISVAEWQGFVAFAALWHRPLHRK